MFSLLLCELNNKFVMLNNKSAKLNNNMLALKNNQVKDQGEGETIRFATIAIAKSDSGVKKLKGQ